jgi:trans-2,3-dihydro-3-hydroxyanthranilate isomerase
MTALPFATTDVFTDRRYTGNPLAIVEAADALGTARMQTMARQFNLSETIFVMAPDDPAHTAKVRIFFPTAEIPFAGHPTIGCAIHLACKRNGPGDFSDLITLEEVAGLVPVTVTRSKDRIQAEFTAPKLPSHHPGPVDASLIAAALGLDRGEIGFGSHAPAMWAAGPDFLFVPVASLDALARARPLQPDFGLLARQSNESIYVYARGEDCDFRARMFAPDHGMPEDPATGSASAILAAQLLASGNITNGTKHFTLHQGVEMGRPSQIGLSVDCNGRAIAAIRIAGSAVPIMTGYIKPPDA